MNRKLLVPGWLAITLINWLPAFVLLGGWTYFFSGYAFITLIAILGYILTNRRKPLEIDVATNQRRQNYLALFWSVYLLIVYIIYIYAINVSLGMGGAIITVGIISGFFLWSVISMILSMALGVKLKWLWLRLLFITLCNIALGLSLGIGYSFG